jgi:transposase
MQGKEASEQETKAKSNVGIDVSKDWLDVHVLPADERLRVPNTYQGVRQLKRWLMRFDLALVAVEATGKWHRHVQRSLAASAIPVAIVDPFRVRMFAKAQGIFAKTDRLDARVLASFAAVMTPSVRPPAPQALTELAELVAARISAVEAQTSLKNQRAAATVKFLQKRIKADDGLARRYAILTSIPSFGFVTAVVLITCLAELGSISAKQSGMLAGLAPIADQSGTRDGARVIFGGRPRVRRVLYLAALTAARFNADMRAFYNRLRAAGKPPKAALIAVARKLVVLANTLISHDRMWQPEPPKYA